MSYGELMVKGARILALAVLVWRDLADAATLSLLRPCILLYSALCSTLLCSALLY